MPAEKMIQEVLRLKSKKGATGAARQDHRGVKWRIIAMLFFKLVKRTAMTTVDVELSFSLRKGCLNLDRLGVQDQAASTVWLPLLLARNPETRTKIARTYRNFVPDPIFGILNGWA
jgi:hypothetical protein